MKVMPLLGFFGLILPLFLLACAPKPIRVEPQAVRSEKKGVYHTVKPGETLWRICKTYGVDMDQVMSLNRIEDPSNIKVGQRIFIPGATKVLEIPPAIIGVDSSAPKFIWPIKGKIVRGFCSDPSRRHDGLDLKAPFGTPIKAAAPGKVGFSGWLRGYGNVVILEHEGGFYTVYAHNSLNLVKEGEWVEEGQIIAQVGDSGNAEGAHLHFEIRKGSKPLDPMTLLPKMNSY
jgi:murein DD-endopeptidase MepM/ murein hydrolase activator NlpD